jgi:hypothetical protein
MFAVIWNFLIAKTAGENLESFEMGTRSGQDGGFPPLSGPFSDRCQCKFSLRSSGAYTRTQKLPWLECPTSGHPCLLIYSETQLPGNLSKSFCSALRDLTWSLEGSR